MQTNFHAYSAISVSSLLLLSTPCLSFSLTPLAAVSPGPTGSSSLAIAVSDLVSQPAICISPLLKSDSLASLLTIATKLITSILLNICSDFHSLVHAHHVPVGYLKIAM